MIDKLLRRPKEYVLAPIALSMARSIQPTHITLAAFGVGVGAALALWQGAAAWGAGLWLLNRALDGLDGTVARLHGKQSDFGGYLDIVLDTIIYAIVPSAIILSAPSTAGWIALLLLLISFYVNGASWMYLAALFEKRQQGAATNRELTTITMPTGLIEGAETVVFFTLFALLPGAAVLLFSIMALLVWVTIAQRLLWAAQVLR